MVTSRRSAFSAKNSSGGWKAAKSFREYDSIFEGKVVEGLKERLQGIVKNPVSREGVKLPYTLPEKNYYPDVVLPNGVCIEAKGLFDSEDRVKLLRVREQNPGVDIRIVFMNPKAKLYKGSKSTYATWCEKNGFLYTKGPAVPDEWLLPDAKHELNHKEE